MDSNFERLLLGESTFELKLKDTNRPNLYGNVSCLLLRSAGDGFYKTRGKGYMSQTVMLIVSMELNLK